MADRNGRPDGKHRISDSAQAGAGRKKRRTNFMALEPRVMYDGAAAATAAGAADHHDADSGAHGSSAQAVYSATPAISEAAPPTPPPPPAPAPVIDAGPAGGADKPTDKAIYLQADPGAGGNGAAPREIVIIDSAVPDIQTLINAVKPGDSVYILQGDKDGVQQIADIIAQNDLHDLASIQIISHGLAGEVRLGSTLLTDASLADHAAALAAIGQSLAPGGDILLYGCDVAQGAVGTQFLSDLSAATRASIAAATHDIGLTAQGENWSLDAATGPIEAALPFGAGIDSYQGLLANPDIAATQT
jgi:uncharacterized protein DUF4347